MMCHLKKFYLLLQDFVFPTNCLSCGVSGSILCDACVCTFPVNATINEHIHAVFSYNTPAVRKALHALKYSNTTSLAKVFAIPLHDKILQELAHHVLFHDLTKPLLLPIPMHKKRKRKRGYNQSELLCKELSLIDTVSFTFKNDVLYKHRSTEAQAEIHNRSHRLENIRGCFSVRDLKKVAGRNIILIDDITTTGATFNEATKELKRAGARKVICFAVAH